MEIPFKAEVVDKEGKPLGTVDHLVRDSWTGEMSKFMIRREDKDFLISVDDVNSADENLVKLKVSLEEINQH